MNVGNVVAWTRHHRFIEHLAMMAYSLVSPMVFAAAVFPAMAGKLRTSKEFLLATIIAALLASCILSVFPAIGPWSAYHFQPYWNQAFSVHELQALRSASPFTANPDYTCELVTFPSFHVTLSVLCAAALWPFRRIRPLLVLLVGAVTISTMMTGWHYATDGIGGMAVAAVGLLCAKRFRFNGS